MSVQTGTEGLRVHNVPLTVTNSDYTLAEMLTNIHEDSNYGVRDRDASCFGRDSSWQSHFRGCIGEITVARWYGLQVNWTAYENGGDPGYDFVFKHPDHGVVTVDTKTAKYDPPWLKVEAKTGDPAKDLKADYYINCYFNENADTPTGHELVIQGGATRERLANAPIMESPNDDCTHENYTLNPDWHELEALPLPDTVSQVDAGWCEGEGR